MRFDIGMEFDAAELKILETLEAAVREPAAAAVIDRVVARVDRALAEHPDEVMAWEPIPVERYGTTLPENIRSSWVFILRAGVDTGAERHPNSHQRMMAYRGDGDFQTRDEAGWHSNFLTSDPAAPLEARWISIPANVWHQSARPATDWVVVSFHTVAADELIEERPDEDDGSGVRRMNYVEPGRGE